MNPDAVRPESIADKVYCLLRHEIEGGKFRPGERVLDQLIAGRLGVSRTPIREALLRLEHDGIVVCTSRRSYNVRALTVRDVKEIYDTLGILEGTVVSQVAPAIESRDVKTLQRLNAEMRRAAERGDLQAFGLWNREFHDLFLLKSQNQTLRGVCDIVRTRLYTFPVRRRSLARWLQKSVREHREIIRLAGSQDGAALGAYFRDVHWSYERNRRFIDDAFDAGGEAGICL